MSIEAHTKGLQIYPHKWPQIASAKGARAFALPSLGAAAQFIAPEYNLSGVTLLRPLDATRVTAISLPFQEITPPGLFS